MLFSSWLGPVAPAVVDDAGASAIRRRPGHAHGAPSRAQSVPRRSRSCATVPITPPALMALTATGPRVTATAEPSALTAPQTSRVREFEARHANSWSMGRNRAAAAGSACSTSSAKAVAAARRARCSSASSSDRTSAVSSGVVSSPGRRCAPFAWAVACPRRRQARATTWSRTALIQCSACHHRRLSMHTRACRAWCHPRPTSSSWPGGHPLVKPSRDRADFNQRWRKTLGRSFSRHAGLFIDV